MPAAAGRALRRGTLGRAGARVRRRRGVARRGLRHGTAGDRSGTGPGPGLVRRAGVGWRRAAGGGAAVSAVPDLVVATKTGASPGAQDNLDATEFRRPRPPARCGPPPGGSSALPGGAARRAGARLVPRSARRGRASCRRTIPFDARRWLRGRRTAECGRIARHGPARMRWGWTFSGVPYASWPCQSCSSLEKDRGRGARGAGTARALAAHRSAPQCNKALEAAQRADPEGGAWYYDGARERDRRAPLARWVGRVGRGVGGGVADMPGGRVHIRKPVP